MNLSDAGNKIGQIFDRIVGRSADVIGIIHWVTDAFATGVILKPGEDPAVKYLKMFDEATKRDITALAKEELARRGWTSDEIKAAFKAAGAWLSHHRQYVPAINQHLAVMTDINAQVRVLLDFVTGDNDDRQAACDEIDQRHPVARALMERFIEAKRNWKQILRTQSSATVQMLMGFTRTLQPGQRAQFALSLGSIRLQSELEMVLAELNAAPDDAARRRIALDRGLITEGGNRLAIAGDIWTWFMDFSTPRPVDPVALANALAELQTATTAAANAARRNPFVWIITRLPH